MAPPAIDPLESSATRYWSAAADIWHWVGSPLRPCDEDVAIAEGAMACFAGELGRRRFRALLLGVTPELAAMRWPRDTRLLAVDNSREMIQAAWPGDVAGHRTALAGDWFALPVVEESLDAMLGDGMLTPLEYPGQWSELARSVRRALRRGGAFILRTFVQSSARETVEAVRSRLAKGEIGSIHALRWRLGMAIQNDPEVGVTCDAIWRAWRDIEPGASGLLGRPGWRAEEIDTLKASRGNMERRHFPSLAKTRTVFDPWFEEVACLTPSYELGECCPTLVYRAR